MSFRHSHAEPIVIDYLVDGLRSAAAVARRESQLVGAVIHDVGTRLFARDELGDVLQQYQGRPRAYHDAVFSLTVESQYGLPQADAFEDTYLMLKLLDENNPLELVPPNTESHNIESTAWPDLAAGRQVQAAAHASKCVQITAALLQELPAHLAAEQLEQVYRLIELPAVAPTADMTSHGLRLDVAAAERLRAHYESRLNQVRCRVRDCAGRPLNPDSYQELCSYLYGQLHLPVEVWTDNGNPSTCDHALCRLVGAHPVVEPLRAYLAGKPVVDALRALTRCASPAGRIFPDLDLLGAVTGRYSCREPNLMGLPSAALPALVADEGHLLVEADLSQTELRVLAQLSGDPGLIGAFAEGLDVHRRTTARVLGISESDVTSEQRSNIGKPVNFGIIYGQSEHGLGQELGVSAAEARSFIAAYFRGYPRVCEWMDSVMRQVQRLGYVATLYGRRRRLPEIGSLDAAIAKRALRQAINSVIQGTAADLLKMAISRLARCLPSDCRLLLSVHDSVLLQLPLECVDTVVPLVREAMEAAPPGFAVPLRVDIRVGHNWSECKTGRLEC